MSRLPDESRPFVLQSARHRRIVVDSVTKKHALHCGAPDDLTKLASCCCGFAGFCKGKSALFRTFIIGLVLGILVAAGALYALPVVDQQRESSLVSVAANGGNVETFHVNIPADRIVVRSPGQVQTVPTRLQWPEDEKLQPIGVELYKIRNERDAVIGVASRTAAAGATASDWLIHFPARGSQLVSVQTIPLPGGVRRGDLRAGSREFRKRSGSVAVRWVPDESADQASPSGRIELLTNYIGTADESR